MAAHDVRVHIKPMSNHKRRPMFNTFLYRYRNLIERFFGKSGQSRAVATAITTSSSLSNSHLSRLAVA